MKSLLVVLAFFSMKNVGASGGVVGNGGDRVKCGSLEGLKDGYYNLDFALKIGEGGKLSELNPDGATWEKGSEDRFGRLFFNKTPLDSGIRNLMGSFLCSTAQLTEAPVSHYPAVQCWKNSSNFRQGWFPTRGKPLEEIPDEGDISKLPLSCKVKLSIGFPDQFPTGLKIPVEQVVVRTVSTELKMILFDYDQPRLKSLYSRPYQFSFLMMHEWLRNFTQDAATIRKLNWFLHSKEADEMSPEQFAARLIELGIDSKYF